MRNLVVNTKLIRQAFTWIVLFACIYALVRLAPALSKPANLPIDDYFHLWAAGKLNLESKNPFDPQIVEQLRLIEGGNPSITKISVMLNPPWFITILMPFSLLPYSISRLVWLIFSIILLLIATIIFWKIYIDQPKLRWLAIIAMILFAPTISMLEKGQISTLAILGIGGFVYFSEVRRNDWLSGIFLTLATIKPQVIILFWIALFLWVIKLKRWIIIFSWVLSTFVLLGIAILVNHPLIREYINSLATYNMSEWATPTIGSFLRFFWLGTDKFWLQYLPSILGGVWIIYYWFRNQRSWNWKDEIPLLLLVSLLVSPYSWTYDLVVALPAIILAAYWLSRAWKHWKSMFFIIVYFVINALDLYLHRNLDEFWFVWLAPALLILFLLIRRYYTSLTNHRALAGQLRG